MRTAIHVALVLGICHAAASIPLDAAGVKVKTEHDRSADFASLRSYRWLPTPPYTIGIAPEARDHRLERDALDGPIKVVGATPTTSLRVIEEGTLVVDVLRRDRITAIWHATATGALDRSRNQEQRLRTIDEAVKKMFAPFPPRR